MQSAPKSQLSWFALVVAISSLWTAHGADGSTSTLNQLTPAEKAAGWQLLWDGATTTGWRGYNQKTFPDHGWVIEDGCLHRASAGGDIITDALYDEFELEFDWKIAPGANSGLKYFVLEAPGGAIGHEYQIVDDQLNSDGKRGAKWRTAAFYDVIPAATNKVLLPPGQFNHSRILVKGKHVEHWLNGGKTVEYELESAELDEAIATSKFRKVTTFNKLLKGHILLQDHGDEVWFRNLKIRLPK